jgi:hypothetical protein
MLCQVALETINLIYFDYTFCRNPPMLDPYNALFLKLAYILHKGIKMLTLSRALHHLLQAS